VYHTFTVVRHVAIIKPSSGTGHNLGPLDVCFTPRAAPLPMDTQLYTALIALGLLVTGSVGAIVKALTDRVVQDLEQNTRITTETREGLRDAVEKLAQARNTILGLREVVRERDDRIAYLVSRMPEAEEVLSSYRSRREARFTAADERAALRRVIDDLDDPTGTDAGAHPKG
jgi:hypothetical protein